jgi:hypothetical protein
MTVVITDSVISAVGQARDISIVTRTAFPVFIANGVTGVRDMGTRSLIPSKNGESKSVRAKLPALELFPRDQY